MEGNGVCVHHLIYNSVAQSLEGLEIGLIPLEKPEAHGAVLCRPELAYDRTMYHPFQEYGRILAGSTAGSARLQCYLLHLELHYAGLDCGLQSTPSR